MWADCGVKYLILIVEGESKLGCGKWYVLVWYRVRTWRRDGTPLLRISRTIPSPTTPPRIDSLFGFIAGTEYLPDIYHSVFFNLTNCGCSFYRSREESNLNGPMWELVRKYIRCSSRTTIGHIKKYLKLKLNLSAVDQVENWLLTLENN